MGDLIQSLADWIRALAAKPLSEQVNAVYLYFPITALWFLGLWRFRSLAMRASRFLREGLTRLAFTPYWRFVRPTLLATQVEVTQETPQNGNYRQYGLSAKIVATSKAERTIVALDVLSAQLTQRGAAPVFLKSLDTNRRLLLRGKGVQETHGVALRDIVIEDAWEGYLDVNQPYELRFHPVLSWVRFTRNTPVRVPVQWTKSRDAATPSNAGESPSS